jgi:Tfp pilus assembly protein PilN
MIEINLIPDVKQELLKAERARAVVISGSIITCIVAGGIVALLAVYIYGVQFGRNIIVDNSIKAGSEKLAKVEDLSKLLTIQNQMKRINELNDTKAVNSRLFDVVAAVTPPSPDEVRVSLLTFNSEETSIKIEGQTKAYDSMEVFKKTIESSVIVYTEDGAEKRVNLASNISLSEISYGEDSDGVKVLRFTLNFKYPPELFSAKIPLLTYKLNIDGNVTDSYLGIPKSIFSERAKDIQS